MYVRDPKTQRLYDRRWQRRRELQLSREPWCAECLRANIYTPATDVHHVQRHQGDPILFRMSPLESLCHACHTIKTNAEMREGGRKVSTRGTLSGGGLPRGKMSPIKACVDAHAKVTDADAA